MFNILKQQRGQRRWDKKTYIRKEMAIAKSFLLFIGKPNYEPNNPNAKCVLTSYL